VDHLGVTEQPSNTKVVLESSHERFLELLLAAVSG
jgi:hypothetical protein